MNSYFRIVKPRHWFTYFGVLLLTGSTLSGGGVLVGLGWRGVSSAGAVQVEGMMDIEAIWTRPSVVSAAAVLLPKQLGAQCQ